MLLAVVVLWAGLLAWSTVATRAGLRDGRGWLVEARAALLAADVDTAALAFAQAEDGLATVDFHLSAPWVLPGHVLPGIGDDLAFGDDLAATAADVARAGVELTAQLQDAVAELEQAQGRLPVEVAAAIVDPTAQLLATLERAGAVVAGGAELSLSSTFDESRRELAEELDGATAQARLAAQLTAAVPGLLGADGPRTYALFASNPAEQRGTGGYLGSYARMVVDDGELDIGSFSRVANLPEQSPFDVLPPNDDYAVRYLPFGGAGSWQNANLTPDFPSAAIAIERLWSNQFGEQIDGVVAVDPFAYAALLEIGGPVTLPGIPPVTAETVVDYVTNGAYADFGRGSDERRQEELGQVAALALENFLRSPVSGDLGATIEVLGDMLADGHLRVHVTDPDAQAALAAAGVDGALRLEGPDGEGGDFLGIVFNNGAANKIDYYVQRDVTYRVRLEPDGRAEAELAVTIYNNAPGEGPRILVGPNAPYLSAGEVYGLLSVYCGAECDVREAPPSTELFDVDFRRRERVVDEIPPRLSRELGSTIVDAWITIPANRSATYTYELGKSAAWEPTPDGGMRYRLVHDNQVTVRASGLTVEVEVPDGLVAVAAPFEAEITPDRVRWVTGGRRDAVYEVLFAPEGTDAPIDEAIEE